MDQPLLCQVMFWQNSFVKSIQFLFSLQSCFLFEEIVFLLWNHNLLKRNYEVIAKSFLKQKYFQCYRNVFICRMFDIDSANGHVMIVNHVTIFTHRMFVNDVLAIICGVMWAFFA